MFLKTCAAFLCVCLTSLIITNVHGKSLYAKGIQECYRKECPENTYGCERHRYMSKDGSQLVTDTSCLGLHGGVLKKYTDSEKNPFDENTYLETYSYMGGYSSDNSGYFGLKSNPSLNTNVQNTPKTKDREPLGSDSNVNEVEVFKK